MSLVFTTATSLPIYAQSRGFLLSQSSPPASSNSSGTRQPNQAFGGQIAVFFRDDSAEFSVDSSVEFSVNSSRILTFKRYALTGYILGSLRLWDTNGNLLAVLQHKDNKIKSAIFSPDGQQVLTTGDQNVRLWDKNGNLLTTLAHKDVATIQFSPDGHRILTIAKRDVHLWDRRGKLLAVLQDKYRVKSVIFSSDSKRILTIGEWEGVKLWNSQGNLLATLETANFSDHAIFSPDGSHILTKNGASKSGCSGRLWDREGHLLAEIRRECGKVSGLIFSHDGNYLLAEADHTVHLWDKRGNFIKEFLHHQEKINSLGFSPDGRYILTYTLSVKANKAKEVIRLWNIKGNLIATIPVVTSRYENAFHSLHFSRGGRYILTRGSDSDSIARLWDAKGNLLATLQHQGRISSLQFSPDGRHILTDSHDKTARLWDLEGKTVAVLQNKGEWLNPVFSPDGNYILASSSNVALLWDKKGNPLAVIQGHAGINSIKAVFSPNGRYIVTSKDYDDKTSRLWDVAAIIAIQKQQREALQSLEAKVSDRNAQLTVVQGSIAELSPDGQYILTAGRYYEARLWDMQGNLLTLFSGHESWIGGIAFSPDSNQILTSAYRAVRLWDRKGNLLAVLRHNDLLRDVVFSPDGNYILGVGGLRSASSLWDRQGNRLVTFPEGNAKFSPDGRFILTFADGANTARLWDKEGNLLTVFKGHQDSVRGAIFSPDGKQILTRSSDKTARLWDRKGNLLAIFDKHGDSVSDAAFSPDGNRILTAGGVTVRLWDTQGELLKVLRGHEDLVFITKFSPDGSRILTAGRDHTARLWDREGNLLAVFRGHKYLIDDAEFTPDGRYIVTVSIQDDTTRVWDISAAIAANAEQATALQASQGSVSNKNAPQAEAALKAAIQLNQQGTLESRQQALQKLDEALKLYRSDNNLDKAAHTLRLMGNIHTNLGQFQAALDAYTQALPLSRQAGAKAEEAAVLNSLGQLYTDLADLQTALNYHQQVLPLLYQLNDKGGAATTFNNIGNIQANNNDWKVALDAYTQALIISRPAGDLAAEATALSNIGSTYIASQDWGTALNAYNQSLLITRHLQDKTKETGILNQLGKINAALGQPAVAQEQYTQALALARQLGYKTEEANILYNQAILNRQQNNLTAAKTGIETAIQITEALRSQIASQELRQSYFARNQEYYQFYIDLLMQLHQKDPGKGYDALALHISERARARSLLEQLTEASLNLKADLDPVLLTEEKHLTKALNAAEQKRLNLLNHPGGYKNTNLEAVKTEINSILQQLQTLEARIRRANPAYANLKYPDPLTLKGIQDKILDDKTLLLQYALGKERSYLFLVSKTDLKTYTLPPKAEIEAAVERYRTLLLSPNFTELGQGQVLSQLLLGPVADRLKGQRLVIVGDGKLQLLPFAALPWGTGKNIAPLMATNEIITLPSATSLAVQREQWQKRPPASKTLAVMADPVFKANDPRLGHNTRQAKAGDLSQYENLIRNGCSDFDRLPNTAAEAEQILALVPDAQRFSATGFEANYATATHPNLSQYQIVHLATHGCIQDNPLLSNLALSFFQPDGQKAATSLLKLQDIYNLKLNADLVVLSACQTGTGKEIQGEGVVGLTRGFMYAGARRVVVSLWSVNDRATSILMSDYYRQMLQQGLSPTAALQKTQLAMWQSGNYAAPYYWAAFTIQGDWY